MKITFNLTAIFLCLFFYSTAQIPVNGLVAWYPYNGNANDSSGHGNNGIVYGATLDSDRFGNQNSAYSFNGVDNYINNGNSSSLQIFEFISISCWFKFYQIPTGSNEDNLFSKFHLAGYGIGANEQDPMSYNRLFAALNINGTYRYVSCELNTINENSWYFLTATYDGSSFKFFINNTKVDSIQLFGTISSSSVPLLTGANPEPATQYMFFNGCMDDIRLYNRALNNNEIESLYKEGIAAPLSLNQLGCIGGPIPNLTATGSNIKWYSDSNLSNLVYSGSSFATG